MRKGRADQCRGLVIAAPASGSGKTTVTLGLLAALRERGLVVQPLKAGPDFIDPGHHTAAAGGRRSRNLDGWMTDRDYVRALVARVTAGAEIALLEGMMGLFDGFDGRSGRGSTAELAAWLGWPVVLVIDAGAAARSVAAVVRGFRTFDPTVEVGGLIFNRAGGAAHLEMLADACAGEGVCVLGGLVFDAALEIRERHLGLHTATETRGRIDYRALGSAVAAQIDLDRLQSLARPGTIARAGVEEGRAPGRRARGVRAVRCRIAVARDAAFCFYYEDNLELLEAAGAELVEWSPLAAQPLPPGTDGIYLGGGYPELHAAALGRASAVRAEIRRFAEQGGMIYAECGGFMFLQRAIRLLDSSEHAMVGVFPGVAAMQSGLQALGYVELEAELDGRRLELRGQEFRHSTLEVPALPAPSANDPVTLVYRVSGRGIGPSEGYAWRQVLGSYIHLHFASAPEIAALLVARAAARRAAGARVRASRDER